MKTLILLLLPLSVFSQQDPISGMYWNNYAVYNPATSGLEFNQDVFVTYRDQWTGLSGAPRTLFGNYNRRLAEHHGIGGNYCYDRSGNSQVHTGIVNYNYQFTLKNESRLSLGVAAGLYARKDENYWIPPTTVDDPTLPTDEMKYAPDLNAGIAFLSKWLYLGVGMRHLDQSRVGAFYQKALHSYFHARIKLMIGTRSDFSKRSQLFISTMTRTDWVAVSTDYNLRLLLREKIWIGTGFRTSKTWTASLGWDIKKRYRIGYQFEWTQNKLQNAHFETHEIVLGFYLD